MRSQMAELFYNSMTDSTDATSAGAVATLDSAISKRATEALAELSINTDGQYSKQLTPQMVEEADRVILFPTDHMPQYALNSSKSETWDVADPHYNKEKGMEFVRQVRDEIKEKIENLIKESEK